MIFTLTLLAGTLAPGFAATGSPSLAETRSADAVEDLVSQAASDWKRIKAMKLSANPYRDKQHFCPDAGDVMGDPLLAKGADAAKALLRGLDDAAPAGRVWRTHELRSRLLKPDPAAAHGALTAAIEAYPEVAYSAPSKHSYFQHLVNARAEFALQAIGGEAAAKEILELLKSDKRFAYFYPEPLHSAFLKNGDAENLKVLFQGAADLIEERDPRSARQLRSWSIPEVLRLGGDPKKLYVLLGGDRPNPKERPLVVVMPGGGGQALNFLPWMQNLTRPLLDEYQFAVLSAPVWEEGQGEEVVWTTKHYKRKYKAKFTAEEFAREVAKEHASAGAYLFAWSSGGPAAYATILHRDNTFRGAYVLGSVFKPKQLDVARAKGKRFVLEQGRGDKITPIRFAEQANEILTKRGAAVKLVPFDGGHGFAMPDAHASLKEALRWLTSQSGD